MVAKAPRWRDNSRQEVKPLSAVSQFVKAHKERKEVTLDLASRAFGDKQLQSVLTSQLRCHIWAQLAALEPEARWHYINVDLSSNDLGSEGAAILVEFLRSCRSHYSAPVYVRVLKLYRNQLGDAGMWWLSQLVLTQPQPLHEIHLSHNGITGAGAAILVLALGCLHPQQVYPFRTPQTPDRFLPCWCRLEMNAVPEPLDFIKHLQNSGNVRIVLPGPNTTEWGPIRAPSYCRIHSKTPQVALYIFDKQLSGAQQTELGDTMALAHETILGLLAAENGAVGNGEAGVPYEMALGSQAPAMGAAWDLQTWENPAPWNQPVCSEDTYGTSMWWPDCAMTDVSDATCTSLPWPLPLPPDTSLPSTATSSPALHANPLEFVPLLPSSATSSPTLHANAPEFVPSTPEPLPKSAMSDPWPWTPPPLRADAVAFVPSAPAKLPNSATKRSLSPRSTVLMLSGAWGALCSGTAAIGAIPLGPPISRAALLRCRPAKKIDSEPVWLRGGRLGLTSDGNIHDPESLPEEETRAPNRAETRIPKKVQEETRSPKKVQEETRITKKVEEERSCCDVGPICAVA